MYAEQVVDFEREDFDDDFDDYDAYDDDDDKIEFNDKMTDQEKENFMKKAQDRRKRCTEERKRRMGSMILCKSGSRSAWTGPRAHFST